MEDVDEETLDDDERAVRAAKIRRILEHREEKRLIHEERDRVKAELALIKFERREVRRLKREAKLAEKMERQAQRDGGKVTIRLQCNILRYRDPALHYYFYTDNG